MEKTYSQQVACGFLGFVVNFSCGHGQATPTNGTTCSSIDTPVKLSPSLAPGMLMVSNNMGGSGILPRCPTPNAVERGDDLACVAQRIGLLPVTRKFRAACFIGPCQEGVLAGCVQWFRPGQCRPRCRQTGYPLSLCAPAFLQ